jgi:long-chain acyl-CoA synthetase
VITVAPMFHGLALIGHTFNVLMGFTVVLPGRFQPASYLAEVERHRAVSLTGVPAFYQALLGSPGIEAHDLSSVRVVQTGGGPIDSATKARLAARLPQAVVTESYGLSEATGTLVATVCDRVDLNPFGTVGRPVSDVQIQIRADDGVTIVDTGGIGEIWARGPQITAGYHNDPELTARQFVDGWLRTGDLGRVDEQGFLFLAGRAKDMIIYKGYNVYPLHLEEILAGHPDVAQVAVVGAVDPSAGEVPVAFVVPRAGADRATLPADLLTYVDERVAPYQRVREIVLTDELPLSATGKVLKTALRERLR